MAPGADGSSDQVDQRVARHNGIGGMWSSQILPFQDIGSYPGSVDFETAVYRALNNG